MKKMTVILALVITLAACSKDSYVAPVYPQPVEVDKFFSRVKFYTDGRQPATDTVVTIRLLNAAMVEAYQANCGMVYSQTSYYDEIGVCWQRKR